MSTVICGDSIISKILLKVRDLLSLQIRQIILKIFSNLTVGNHRRKFGLHYRFLAWLFHARSKERLHYSQV